MKRQLPTVAVTGATDDAGPYVTEQFVQQNADAVGPAGDLE